MIIRLLLILAFAALCFSPLGQHFLQNLWVKSFMLPVVPFLLVPLPLILALLKRTVPLEGARAQFQTERIRALTRDLWIGTALGMGVVVLTQIWLHNFSTHLCFLAGLIFCFVLEALFARPLIQEKNPAIESDAFMPEAARTASLTSRHKVGVPPRWAWFLAWGIWTIAAFQSLSCLVPSAS